MRQKEVEGKSELKGPCLMFESHPQLVKYRRCMMTTDLNYDPKRYLDPEVYLSFNVKYPIRVPPEIQIANLLFKFCQLTRFKFLNSGPCIRISPHSSSLSSDILAVMFSFLTLR